MGVAVHFQSPMANPIRTEPSAPSESVLPAKYWLPLLVAIAVTGAVLAFSELAYRAFGVSRGEMDQRMAVQTKILELQKTISAAESGQRGYLLTRRTEYLEPFQRSVTQLRVVREQLRDMVANDKALRDQLGELNELITLKYAELRKSIDLASAGDFATALASVETGEGRELMLKLDTQFDQMSKLAEQAVTARGQGWEDTLDSGRNAIFAVVALNAVLISMLALVLIRDTRRARENAATEASFAARMKREVAERTSQLSSLSEFLQTQSEQEKTKLARELHDELGGILTPAKMDVNWLEGRLGSDPEVGERLARLSKLLDSGIDVKRRIIEYLRPSLLDHLGLGAALRWHVEETCKAAGLECTLAISEAIERVSPDLEIALYRIVQECLTNVVRHGKAKRVDVAVDRTSEGIVILVRDDGIGIADIESAMHRSFGIGGMRQRLSGVGGTLNIDSAPRQGTTVRAFVPRDRSIPIPSRG
jgi:signal transduction histidine kinase